MRTHLSQQVAIGIHNCGGTVHDLKYRQRANNRGVCIVGRRGVRHTRHAAQPRKGGRTRERLRTWLKVSAERPQRKSTSSNCFSLEGKPVSATARLTFFLLLVWNSTGGQAAYLVEDNVVFKASSKLSKKEFADCTFACLQPSLV